MEKKKIPLSGRGSLSSPPFCLHVGSRRAREDNKINSHPLSRSGLFSLLLLAVVTILSVLMAPAEEGSRCVVNISAPEDNNRHLDSTTNYCSYYSLKLVYLFLYRSTSSYKLYVFC